MSYVYQDCNMIKYVEGREKYQAGQREGEYKLQRRWWEAPISSLGISHQHSLLVKTNRNTFTEGSCALAGALKAQSYHIVYREKDGLTYW